MLLQNQFYSIGRFDHDFSESAEEANLRSGGREVRVADGMESHEQPRRADGGHAWTGGSIKIS